MLNLHLLNSKKTASALIALATFFALSPAQAEPKFPIAGNGAISCGQYLRPPKISKEASDTMMVTWIQGYLSGANAQRYIESNKEMKLQPDPESIIAFVDKYCRENPLKNVFDASLSLDFSY